MTARTIRKAWAAPGLGLAGNFRTNRLAHGVAGLEHIRQRQVAQAADGGAADVCPQRTARVGILEQITRWDR